MFVVDNGTGIIFFISVTFYLVRPQMRQNRNLVSLFPMHVPMIHLLICILCTEPSTVVFFRGGGAFKIWGAKKGMPFSHSTVFQCVNTDFKPA